MEYYSAIKKEWNNAICSNLDGPRDYHTEWSKSDKERQISFDITSMWNLRNSANELIYKTETDSHIENKLMVTKGERGVEGYVRNLGLTDTHY